MNQRIAIVAVAAAQRSGVAVAVEIQQPAAGLQRLGHERRAGTRDLAGGLPRRDAQDDADRREPERDGDQGDPVRPVGQAAARCPGQHNRHRRDRRGGCDLGPGREAEVVAPGP